MATTMGRAASVWCDWYAFTVILGPGEAEPKENAP